jgi:hypothetical protein
MGTRVKVAAGAGADDAGCPVEAPDGVGTEPAGVVAPAPDGAVGDCGADAGDVAWAEVGREADDLEPCEVHPAMRTPARARAAPPVSNVR